MVCNFRFGSRFQDGTNGQFGVLEMIMSTAISGILFSTFAGQPLSILGATGPFLAYTLVVYDLAIAFELLGWLTFLTTRFLQMA